MIFYDIDSLAQKQGIDNKYLLTVAVANRARTLSEQKGRTLDEDNEKFISTALQEFDFSAVHISLEDSPSGKDGAVPDSSHE